MLQNVNILWYVSCFLSCVCLFVGFNDLPILLLSLTAKTSISMDCFNSKPSQMNTPSCSEVRNEIRERSDTNVCEDDDVLVGEDGCNEAPVCSIVEIFGDEIQKTIANKKRKLEEFTKRCNTSRQKVDAVLEFQKNSRMILYDEFNKRSSSMLDQWNKDVDKIKSIEDQLQNLWCQQMRHLNQLRDAHDQRFKNVRLLHSEFVKHVADMESTHEDQHQEAMRGSSMELKTLQKQFLAETRCQDVTQVRKSLQSLLEA